MGYIYKLVNLQDYILSNTHQYFEMVLYAAVCFFLPLFVGHPQIFVGIMVNTLLIASALNVKGNKLLPVIIAPALGALSRGILFGPFTIFLVYMIPFIWIGNFILVFAIKQLALDKKINRFVSLGIGAIAKALFLFIIAFTLVKIGFLPAVFLTAMGIMQLYTAIAGGLLAFGLQGVKKKVV